MSPVQGQQGDSQGRPTLLSTWDAFMEKDKKNNRAAPVRTRVSDIYRGLPPPRLTPKKIGSTWKEDIMAPVAYHSIRNTTPHRESSIRETA